MTIAFIKDWNGYEAGDGASMAEADEDSLVARGIAIKLESVLVSTDAYTVATLPAGTAGMRAYVTDATTPTWNGALTGGGAVVCPVFHNGTAWVSA